MEYSREETEAWLYGDGELPEKPGQSTRNEEIKRFVFDDVILILDKKLNPTIRSKGDVKVKLVSFNYEQKIIKGKKVAILRLAYQQGKNVIRITKETCEI